MGSFLFPMLMARLLFLSTSLPMGPYYNKYVELALWGKSGACFDGSLAFLYVTWLFIACFLSRPCFLA